MFLGMGMAAAQKYGNVCVGVCLQQHLTHIKLKSLILEGVCAASSSIMLLQD